MSAPFFQQGIGVGRGGAKLGSKGQKVGKGG